MITKYELFVEKYKSGENLDPLNEGLLGNLFGWFKKKMQNWANRLAAAKILKPIFEEYEKKIDDLFKDKEFVAELKTRIEKFKKGENPNEGQEGQVQQPQGQQQQPQQVKNEAVDANANKDVNVKDVNKESESVVDKGINMFLENVEKVSRETLVKKGRAEDIKKLKPVDNAYLQLALIDLREKTYIRIKDFTVKKLGVDEKDAEKAYETKLKEIAEQAKKADENTENVLKQEKAQKEGAQGEWEPPVKGELVKEEEIEVGKIYAYDTKDDNEKEITLDIEIKGKPVEGKVKAVYMPQGADKYKKSKDEQEFSIDKISHIDWDKDKTRNQEKES